MPKLRYVFGDEKDFPLKQAVNHILGKPVVTHADVQKKKKELAAEKKAKEAKEAKEVKPKKEAK